MISRCRIYCYETQEMIVARDYRELAELFAVLDADDSLYSAPMQATGVVDKNGKEIFEGDIVKTERLALRASGLTCAKIIGTVKNLEGAWIVDTGNTAVFLWTEIEENEVIGNVYEQPEYLKKRGN